MSKATVFALVLLLVMLPIIAVIQLCRWINRGIDDGARLILMKLEQLKGNSK